MRRRWPVVHGRSRGPLGFDPGLRARSRPSQIGVVQLAHLVRLVQIEVPSSCAAAPPAPPSGRRPGPAPAKKSRCSFASLPSRRTPSRFRGGWRAGIGQGVFHRGVGRDNAVGGARLVCDGPPLVRVRRRPYRSYSRASAPVVPRGCPLPARPPRNPRSVPCRACPTPCSRLPRCRARARRARSAAGPVQRPPEDVGDVTDETRRRLAHVPAAKLLHHETHRRR